MKHLLKFKLFESSKNGLMVFPIKDKDKLAIEKWLESSDYYAEWDSEGFFLFFEEPNSYDTLEEELNKEFNLNNINVRFEGI